MALQENGLYTVQLTQQYKDNVAGDICGLPPDEAAALLASGGAVEYPLPEESAPVETPPVETPPETPISRTRSRD